MIGPLLLLLFRISEQLGVGYSLGRLKEQGRKTTGIEAARLRRLETF